ncbi:hypothetical protein [Chitinophaga pinensis]|nr:hypothetical protein [Chitinophaga pinensis]
MMQTNFLLGEWIIDDATTDDTMPVLMRDMDSQTYIPKKDILIRFTERGELTYSSPVLGPHPFIYMRYQLVNNKLITRMHGIPYERKYEVEPLPDGRLHITGSNDASANEFIGRREMFLKRYVPEKGSGKQE